MKTVLLIEDEKILRDILGESLQAEEFSVFSAPDGEAGLAIALKENPDIILLDVILPKLSGLEVLKKIREDPLLAKTPVILLTNLEDQEVMRAAEDGFAQVLVKGNYGFEEIVKKVKEILSR